MYEFQLKKNTGNALETMLTNYELKKVKGERFQTVNMLERLISKSQRTKHKNH